MELLTCTIVISDTASNYANTQNARLQSTVGCNPRRYQHVWTYKPKQIAETFTMIWLHFEVQVCTARTRSRSK